MARKTIEAFTSDLSGTPIRSVTPTVEFGLDGTSYRIDLTVSEQRDLRHFLAPYVAEAREVRASQVDRPAPLPVDRTTAATIRRWAAEHGYVLTDRGRIPKDVREAYENRAT